MHARLLPRHPDEGVGLAMKSDEAIFTSTSRKANEAKLFQIQYIHVYTVYSIYYINKYILIFKCFSESLETQRRRLRFE